MHDVVPEKFLCSTRIAVGGGRDIKVNRGPAPLNINHLGGKNG